MNVRGSVQCGRVNSRANFFQLIIKIDQSEMTKSHMFNTSLRLMT